MADDKTKRGGADRKLIALTEKYEVAYWSKKFKVTPAKLKYAVKKVGHSARKVESTSSSRSIVPPTRAGLRSAKPMKFATGRRNSRSPRPS